MACGTGAVGGGSLRGSGCGACARTAVASAGVAAFGGSVGPGSGGGDDDAGVRAGDWVFLVMRQYGLAGGVIWSGL